MPRRRRTAHEIAKPPPPEAIDPHAIYRLRELPRLLRIGRMAIRDEIASGALVPLVKGGRYLFLGEALLAWARASQGVTQGQPNG